MKYPSSTVFTTRTVTYAEKAKRLLAQSAISASVVKLDPALSPRGCAFGIEFDSRHKDNVRQILSRNGVPFGQ
ncbi:MAG: DUF3343 domain-containing protein [Clostridia bacterium]|nr:DUF3343 domain-containing protein [Clostridia bacterium]